MFRLAFVLLLTVSVQTVFAEQEPEVPSRDRVSSLSDREATFGELTSSEAYAKWKANADEVTLIDVRTPEEYVFVGHAEMAWNIPLRTVTYEGDAENRRISMAPNPQFIAQVKEVAKPRDPVLLICRSGSRSAAAAELLVEAGFQRVFNVLDGFEGGKVNDPQNVFHGKRMKNGWKNAGLPWTYDVEVGKMRLPVTPTE